MTNQENESDCSSGSSGDLSGDDDLSSDGIDSSSTSQNLNSERYGKPVMGQPFSHPKYK